MEEKDRCSNVIILINEVYALVLTAHMRQSDQLRPIQFIQTGANVNKWKMFFLSLFEWPEKRMYREQK